MHSTSSDLPKERDELRKGSRRWSRALGTAVAVAAALRAPRPGRAPSPLRPGPRRGARPRGGAAGPASRSSRPGLLGSGRRRGRRAVVASCAVMVAVTSPSLGF